MRGGSVPGLLRSEPGAEKREAGSSERGAGRLKSVVWLAILACLIYVGIKTVPVLFDEYEFQDAIESAARFGSVNNQTPDDIRDGLVRQAETDNIPIKPEDIHVTKGSGDVSIDVQYSVTVDLGVRQWTFNFHPTAHNAAL
jgi:Domain of unknown function (DUF4845)